MTFGQVIASERKKLGLSQKELAGRIKKEDGMPISPQYLNDIERDRRNAPPEHLMDQLADELNLPREYLYFLAGEMPADLRNQDPKPEKVKAAFQAFRKTLNKGE